MINYYLLTKPGIIIGNLITMFAGFLLASQGVFYPTEMFGTLAGLVFIVASACVLNNVLDRNLDKQMKRTNKRPLVEGKVSPGSAVIFALFLGFLGNVTLYTTTNLLTLFLADLGLVIYVFCYTIWKGKTIYGTAIGSLAGALPPVIGYTAIANRLDLTAFLLFFLLVLWQMPHFFSIAIMHFEDYARAKIPVLPIVKGVARAKIHMVLYIVAFGAAAAFLAVTSNAGTLFLLAALTTGVAWIGLSLFGFLSKDNHAWAELMFKHSLITINALSFSLFFDVLYPLS